MQQMDDTTERACLTQTDAPASIMAGGRAYLADVARRLAPSCARSESRHRVQAYLQGLRSEAERQNSWQVAEVCGESTPDGFQSWLRRADWDAEAVREALRHYVVPHLGDPHGVLVLDETGFVKKGRHSAGVARQYRGTLGTVDHGQIGVLLSDASPLGHALLDRELYLPQEWTDARERCRQAGMPEDRGFATKPQLAQQMLARPVAAGVPATWGTGDSGYGDDRRLRMWLESQLQASVLAGSGKDYVWLGSPQRQVKTLLASLPAEGWTRLRAGDGAKGPRWYDWRWVSLADPVAPTWRRWWLVRRRLSEPTDLTADVVFAPQATTLEAGVQGAGSRWTVESSVEAATGDVGLEQDEVRRGTAWDSAYPARDVGVGPADRHAGRDHGGRGLKKKSAAPPGGEPAGGVQGPARPGLPLSVPELRRRLWRFVLAVPQTVRHLLAWSQWRRRHQSIAQYYHYKRREALIGAMAA
jgi:SRSO17 transposase